MAFLLLTFRLSHVASVTLAVTVGSDSFKSAGDVTDVIVGPGALLGRFGNLAFDCVIKRHERLEPIAEYL